MLICIYIFQTLNIKKFLCICVYVYKKQKETTLELQLNQIVLYFSCFHMYIIGQSHPSIRRKYDSQNHLKTVEPCTFFSGCSKLHLLPRSLWLPDPCFSRIENIQLLKKHHIICININKLYSHVIQIKRAQVRIKIKDRNIAL